MIRVRPIPPPPDVLVAEGSKGVLEREKAVAFFKVAANANEKFTFSAYSDTAVRHGLNAVFHFKCAYCEAYFGATQPVAVEHYRPKSGYVGVDSKLKRPGYYWLAATWENLLPSCTDCNTARRQEVDGEDPRTIGKGNQFPLADEQSRAKKPGDEKTEKRILLHPYWDHPERHLVFDETGAIKPARDKRGRESKKGAASIEVYALRRTGLALERARVATLIRATMKTIEEQRIVFAQTGHPLAEKAIRDGIATLKTFLDSKSPYSAMARQIARDFVADIE